MTWPTGRHPVGPGVTLAAPRAAPKPIPAGRGRWRLTLHNRQFAPVSWQQTLIAELTAARGRQVTKAWNQPATLTFTLDGRSQAAALVKELACDVWAWRWDETGGQDFPAFRGVVAQSEDQLSEQENVVTFTCHDYLSMLSRRMLTATYTRTGTDQDIIIGDLIGAASATASSSGTSFAPGSYLPLRISQLDPAGNNRAYSGQLRDRTYYPQQNIGAAFDDLAHVVGGFDYEITPGYASLTTDTLIIYYPYQGVTRSDIAFVYGSTVSALTRTVNSGDYANYWRVLGNNGASDPAAAQFFNETWNTDANNVTVNPVGLWMSDDNAADVTVASTLADQAAGDLALSGTLTPSYSLSMRPGAYSWHNPNMGDVVPLIVQSGRLNVNTTVRVLGIVYDIGDDGQEDVTLTVGRPTRTLLDLLTQANNTVDALTRR